MPEIDHVQVAGGNHPPLFGFLDKTKIYALTKKTDVVKDNYILEFSLDNLYLLSAAVDSGGSIDFDPILEDNQIKYPNEKRPITYYDKGNVKRTEDTFIGAVIRRVQKDIVKSKSC